MSISAPADGPGGLLERGESIARLEELLAAVRSSSEGRLVVLGGEAGVGKTALLRNFCERQASPLRVLWGSCEPLLTPRPLGPLLDVAAAVGGEFEQLVSGVTRPHEVTAALLRELGRRGPTVLVLEDVHWADEATLDVLAGLASRIGSAPALVLASYRNDELDRSGQLRYILGELVRGPGRLRVEPLSPAGVAILAKPHGIDGGELYRLTGGNPFFVTEALAVGGDRIPETVRDAVLARAARLPGPPRSVLEAIAIVSGGVDLWLLEALVGEELDGLEECLASGMITSGRARVAFRHELARRAIEEAIAPNRSVALHRRALSALTAHGGDHPDLARLAHHAEGAGDVMGVLRWAPLAAERAGASGAHREAAALYERALSVPEGLSLQRRTELLGRRVDECWMTDQLDAAIEAQRDALRCRRLLGDPSGEGDALRTLSRLLFFVGQVREGEARALEAVDLLERLPPGHELAMAYGTLAQRRMVLEDRVGAVEWGTRALELAERLADNEALAYALTSVGIAELRAGSDDGLAKLRQALALAQREGLEDDAGRAFANLVRCGVQRHRFDVAEAYLDPGLDYCDERGLDTWRLYLLACRAWLELDRGQWDEAADSVRLVLRDPRSATYPRGMASIVLGLVRARRGDPQATAPLAEETPVAQATEEAERVVQVVAASAEAAWLAGDTASVGPLTDAALAIALERRSYSVGRVAYWRWRAGLRDELPPGTVAEPYSLSIAGEWRRAADLWRELGCPYEAALALGDGDDDAMRQAIEELQRLGAMPARAIIARRLRERGVRGVPRGPRRTTRENAAGLTARELEVLGVLAEGLSNAQIAERLFVSHKTVDHHVSAILRKLDAPTRGQAAAQAVRLGLTGPGAAAPPDGT